MLSSGAKKSILFTLLAGVLFAILPGGDIVAKEKKDKKAKRKKYEVIVTQPELTYRSGFKVVGGKRFELTKADSLQLDSLGNLFRLSQMPSSFKISQMYS